MSKPIAVLISDIHYDINTLEVADKATRLAVSKANELGVHLIIAGDLHNTKANIRGECIKAIMDTLGQCRKIPLILRGNHDSIHEKSTEHSLEFLQGIAALVSTPQEYEIVLDDGSEHHIKAIPYYNDPDQLRTYLKTLPKGSTLIMHQGLQDTEAGHYFMDKSSILKEDVKDFRVISGHYHTRQTIKTRPLPHCIAGSFSLIQEEHALHSKGIGTWDYIGNPYTLGFGEANDPEKGFQVLYDDGSLEFIPTNLRKHIIYEIDAPVLLLDLQMPLDDVRMEDILWIKAKGSTEQLSKLSKTHITKILSINPNFRLDLIPTDTKTSKQPESQNLPQAQVLDNLIDSLTNTDDNRKAKLKELWKNFKE